MQNQNPPCIYCNSIKTKKIGNRKNKSQEIQRYKCNSCNKSFTTKQIKNKSYPAKIILNTISYYNLGHTQKEVSRIIAQKHKLQVPQKTISNWIKEYKPICGYTKLRELALKQYNYSPKNIIQKQTFNHIQPYTFKYHKAKLSILLKQNSNFATLKGYVEKINSDKFPHHIFTHHQKAQKNSRASEAIFEYLNVKISKKENLSIKLAKLALNLAKINKERHQKIQDFMLINDSTTVATEIPTYLTNWDAAYYKNQKGFVFQLNNYTTPITGHIDILQISNGLIHILDYKPDANKINPIEQLTIYAMALSRKLNLPLSDFKCAWFDHNDYFEFFPLHAVYEKRK